MTYFTVKLINKKVIKNTCFLNSSSLYNQVRTRESISCRIPTGMCNVQLTWHCTSNACNYIICATNTKCKIVPENNCNQNKQGSLQNLKKIYLWMLNIKWLELTTSVCETCKNFLCYVNWFVSRFRSWLIGLRWFEGTININLSQCKICANIMRNIWNLDEQLKKSGDCEM